ncbi:hypothetical protein OAI07_01420 [Akkermansiaceae bacterium]|nr:hypothetical protein [Akkermansiaceae bacterium]
MSLHAQISPETLERLRIQQRNNTITSVLISILVVVLLGVVMFWFLLPGAERYTDEIVAYQTSADDKKEVTKPKIQRSVETKPTTPAASASMAKVLTSSSVSAVSIPVVAEVETAESENFGESLSFGDGWEAVDFAEGVSSSTSFFDTKISGDHILYIIDYSLSMNKDDKVSLMKEELENSVKQLEGGAKYQLMFFAGPVWIASDTIQDVRGARENTITTVGGDELKWADNKTDGNIRQVDWLTVSKDTIKDSVKQIRDSPLVLGTRWEPSFEMALVMSPQPDAIIFMTDGVAGGNPTKEAEKLASLAKNAGITVSAVALLEPKAREAMIELGKTTNGSFAIIGEGGKKLESEDFSK